MALMVFLQEDEDVPSVYRVLKIFCETAPCLLWGDSSVTVTLFKILEKDLMVVESLSLFNSVFKFVSLLVYMHLCF